ncbi:hypothetical protein [Pandoraea norimbergensis]|nr:hypothetical protein [Pandoraea norimbergensis]
MAFEALPEMKEHMRLLFSAAKHCAGHDITTGTMPHRDAAAHH